MKNIDDLNTISGRIPEKLVWAMVVMWMLVLVTFVSL